MESYDVRIGPIGESGSTQRERRGRAWLMWSFIICPCHLPVTMTVIGTLLGGSALGTFLTRNTLAVGVVLGALYAVGLFIGFRHLRAAAAAKDCRDSNCRVQTSG